MVVDNVESKGESHFQELFVDIGGYSSIVFLRRILSNEKRPFGVIRSTIYRVT